MPKGYWIVRVDITDQEKYKAYIAANAGPFKKYGARFLVRAGRFDAPEGTSRMRNAVIEFPSYEAAVECWHSPEYSNCDSPWPLRTSSSSKDTKVRSLDTAPRAAHEHHQAEACDSHLHATARC